MVEIGLGGVAYEGAIIKVVGCDVALAVDDGGAVGEGVVASLDVDGSVGSALLAYEAAHIHLVGPGEVAADGFRVAEAVDDVEFGSGAAHTGPGHEAAYHRPVGSGLAGVDDLAALVGAVPDVDLGGVVGRVAFADDTAHRVRCSDVAIDFAVADVDGLGGVFVVDVCHDAACLVLTCTHESVRAHDAAVDFAALHPGHDTRGAGIPADDVCVDGAVLYGTVHQHLAGNAADIVIVTGHGGSGSHLAIADGGRIDLARDAAELLALAGHVPVEDTAVYGGVVRVAGDSAHAGDHGDALEGVGVFVVDEAADGAVADRAAFHISGHAAAGALDKVNRAFHFDAADIAVGRITDQGALVAGGTGVGVVLYRDILERGSGSVTEHTGSLGGSGGGEILHGEVLAVVAALERSGILGTDAVDTDAIHIDVVHLYVVGCIVSCVAAVYEAGELHEVFRSGDAVRALGSTLASAERSVLGGNRSHIGDDAAADGAVALHLESLYDGVVISCEGAGKALGEGSDRHYEVEFGILGFLELHAFAAVQDEAVLPGVGIFPAGGRYLTGLPVDGQGAFAPERLRGIVVGDFDGLNLFGAGEFQTHCAGYVLESHRSTAAPDGRRVVGARAERLFSVSLGRGYVQND